MPYNPFAQLSDLHLQMDEVSTGALGILTNLSTSDIEVGAAANVQGTLYLLTDEGLSWNNPEFIR